MTFLELQKEVAARLGLDFSSLRYHSLTNIKDAINEGYEVISEATEWYETSQSVSFTTSIYYDLWSVLTKPFLALRRVFNNTNSWWLRRMSVQQLDDAYYTWELNTGGSPEAMFMRAASWLGTFPKLLTAAGSMTVKYAGIPDSLSADGDTPGFPVVHHSALADYAAYDLLCQEKEFDRSMDYWAAYLIHEAALSEWVKARLRMDYVAGLREPGDYLG